MPLELESGATFSDRSMFADKMFLHMLTFFSLVNSEHRCSAGYHQATVEDSVGKRVGFLSLSEDFSCTPAPAGQAGGSAPVKQILQPLPVPAPEACSVTDLQSLLSTKHYMTIRERQLL